MSEVIGCVARLHDRPERLALVRPDGTVSNWFAADQSRDDVAAVLACAGMTLQDDDTVVPA